MNLNLHTSTVRSAFSLKTAARWVLVLGAVIVSSLNLSASITTYSGLDLGAGPGGTFSNSNSAYGSFSAAAGSLSTITFENSPQGYISSLAVASGITLTGESYAGGEQFINDKPNATTVPALDGFNTTAGGSNYLELEGGTATFTFANGISCFGAYFTGLQTVFYSDNITFSDGSSEIVYVPGAGTSSSVGGVAFVGFTDPGASITSITITASNQYGVDYIGVDDVSYAAAAVTTTPEPGSVVLMLTGCMALGLVAWRRRAALMF